MWIINGYSGVVHSATKVRDEGVGEIYRLLCGREVYVGMIKSRYSILLREDGPLDATVLCRRCMRKKKAAQAEAN